MVHSQWSAQGAWLRQQGEAARALTWLAVALGGIFRLGQAFSDRSLWLDEIMLSLNILDRSFAELIQPLTLNQGASLGSLWLQKLFTLTLGEGEFALRVHDPRHGRSAVRAG